MEPDRIREQAVEGCKARAARQHLEPLDDDDAREGRALEGDGVASAVHDAEARGEDHARPGAEAVEGEVLPEALRPRVNVEGPDLLGELLGEDAGEKGDAEDVGLAVTKPFRPHAEHHVERHLQQAVEDVAALHLAPDRVQDRLALGRLEHHHRRAGRNRLQHLVVEDEGEHAHPQPHLLERVRALVPQQPVDHVLVRQRRVEAVDLLVPLGVREPRGDAAVHGRSGLLDGEHVAREEGSVRGPQRAAREHRHSEQAGERLHARDAAHPEQRAELVYREALPEPCHVVHRLHLPHAFRHHEHQRVHLRAVHQLLLPLARADPVRGRVHALPGPRVREAREREDALEGAPRVRVLPVFRRVLRLACRLVAVTVRAMRQEGTE
eukprot:60618-Rhodomonas_salina.1